MPGYGMAIPLALGAPLPSANRVANCRTVRAGFVGTSHAWPNARSSVAAVVRARAASVTDVQLCGTSSGDGEYARLPARSGLALTVESTAVASMLSLPPTFR